eukprot:GEZU01013800.1.p1 GENE.GEZU01013800.1~~GEZU01013800.1.p1  ORF type:complete len:635 (+),score=260.36 GEZU01013800.1:46-1950(+)
MSSNANRRLQNTLNHLYPEKDNINNNSVIGTEECAASAKSTKFSSDRVKLDQADLKWNGWGYKDTAFVLNKNGVVEVTGNRYLLSGKVLPNFRKWFEDVCGLDIANATPAKPMDLTQVPPPIINKGFMDEIESSKCFSKFTFDAESRLLHAHGHTCQEIFTLRYGKFKRYPDVVIYPGEHAHVEKIVKAAVKHNVCIIPYGGGTSVTDAIECPAHEKRMIVSLDMHDMNKIKWVDKNNMTACFEAGCIGIEIDLELKKQGLCLGHEPDSFEFSTVGGWVATRASGMKKNTYGNIEDLLVNVKVVTPIGTIEKGMNVPRHSTGPDIAQLVMGSEGTLGVITEAILKIRPLPEAVEYGSIVFPDYATGCAFMREVARQRAAPTSIRLLDNDQFTFGASLKPESNSKILEPIGEWLKKQFLTKVHGIDLHKLAVCTLLFEGDKALVQQQQEKIFKIASQFKGISAGADNGMRGYLLTYVIAYLRDYGFEYSFMAESFETSCPWDKVVDLTENVKKRVRESVAARGIKEPPLMCARVTQTYDAGACIYFYYGFVFRTLSDPVQTFSEIEAEARDEILRNGGSLSHHHGVGKLRRRQSWMEYSLSAPGLEILKKVKETVDPQNIFGNGNLIDDGRHAVH